MTAFFKIINAIIAFLLELCMLFSLGYFGFHNGTNYLWKFVTGLGLPVMVILLWGYFAAPKSKNRLSTPYLIPFKLVLYFATSLLLYQTGEPVYAFTLAGMAVLNETAALLLKQYPRAI